MSKAYACAVEINPENTDIITDRTPISVGGAVTFDKGDVPLVVLARFDTSTITSNGTHPFP